MINFTNFNPVTITKANKKGGRKGSLTIICSLKNGKRLMISEELANTLQLTDSVKIGFINDTLVLGKHLPGEHNTFMLKKLGKKYVIYSSELIMTIAEKQKISFENKVSYTWYKPIVDEYENIPVVLFESEVKEHV